jgi:undecaprenyl-diphosphatase
MVAAAGSRPDADRNARVRSLALAAAGLAVLVVSGAIAHDGRVGPSERKIFRAINDRPDWLYRPLWPFQQFGNIVIALLVGVVVAAVVRNWRLAVAVLAAVVAKLGAEKLIKSVVERRRPASTVGHVHLHGVVPEHGLSFVSGHAVITAAVAGLVAPVLARRWRPLPWVIVALNGVTRIYVGAHNPLDIVGGIGAGLVIAGLLNAVLQPARGHHPARRGRATGPGAQPAAGDLIPGTDPS